MQAAGKRTASLRVAGFFTFNSKLTRLVKANRATPKNGTAIRRCRLRGILLDYLAARKIWAGVRSF